MAWPKGKPRPPNAGRKKGTPNKVTAEKREMLAAILEKRLPDLDAMIEDTWRGIEIEKTMANGETVVGRFNASASEAAKLVLAAAEFCLPKLQRVEKTLAQYADAELLEELERREKLAKPPTPPPPPPPPPKPTAEPAGMVQ
jgi:hypothetical protein